MAGRFALLNENELKKLTDKCKNRNTTYSTQTWINSYRAWAIERQKNVDLEQYSPLELNRVLCQFYAELRKADGSEYEPDSLRVMQAGLNRYLREKQYGKCIMNDIEFKESCDVLEGKARFLREIGKGKKPFAAEPLTMEEERQLWETGKLGASTPTSLLHTVWFLNTQHFGLRGRQEHVDMTMENFTSLKDQNGTEYIIFYEDLTKTRQRGLNPIRRKTKPKMYATGDSMCPVYHFNLFKSKRPQDMKESGRFYLKPR